MAALLKEKDEIINQVMAEGEELLSLFLCMSNGIFLPLISAETKILYPKKNSAEMTTL